MMLRPQPRDHRRCELASRNKTDSEGAEAELLVHMKRERRRCEANDQTPARPSDLLNPFLKRLMEEVIGSYRSRSCCLRWNWRRDGSRALPAWLEDSRTFQDRSKRR